MKNGNTNNQTDNQTSFAVGYSLGHCETWLDIYSQGLTITRAELTDRVAALLLTKTSRQVLGTEDNMSPLRGSSTKTHKTTRTLAVARRPYRKSPKSNRSVGMKNWWASLSPLKRKRIVNRMNAGRRAKRLAKS